LIVNIVCNFNSGYGDFPRCPVKVIKTARYQALLQNNQFAYNYINTTPREELRCSNKTMRHRRNRLKLWLPSFSFPSHG